MNDMNHDSPQNGTQPADTSSRTEQADDAALALKSSVLADAQHLSDQAKHVAGDVFTHARSSAEAQISGGKDRVAGSLANVADAIRTTGEQLRSTDDRGLTEYVARAANQVEAASEYLKERSLGEVLGDVGSFARREPAMFLGGAFVLGLVGGRFLKSSQVHSAPQSGRSGSGPQGEQPTGQHGASARARGNSSSRGSGGRPGVAKMPGAA